MNDAKNYFCHDYRHSLLLWQTFLSRVASAAELVCLRRRATLFGAVVNEEFETRPYSLSSFNLLPGIISNFFLRYRNSFLTFPPLSHRMEAVFAWCKGAKFVEVQKLTGSFEGTTIRTLRRLEELVRQITNAAKAFGDKELEAKFEEGSKLIKRDIVFCSSLYL